MRKWPHMCSKALLVILIADVMLSLTYNYSLCCIEANTNHNYTETQQKRLKHFKPLHSFLNTNSSLVTHEAIYICSDLDFSKYNFSGNGSSSNPFLIQNYNITTQDSYGIYILNITKHVIIRNCFIKGQYGAIFIREAANGTLKIENNFCSDFPDHYERQVGIGIDIGSCPYITIRNNTCFSDVTGIEIRSSPNSIIEYNNCSLGHGVDYSIPFMPSGQGIGISLLGSPNCTIKNNFIIKNGVFGLQVSNSDNSRITDNEFYFNGFGAYIFDSFSGMYGALMVEKSSKISITNNKIDTNDGKAILLDHCSNVSIIGNYAMNNTFSVFIDHCTKYNVYNNTFILSYHYGIYVVSSTEGFIYWNLVQESTCHALVLDSSSNNIIYYNSFAYTNCKQYDFYFWRFPTSEAYDNGKGNKWYNATIKKGNWWTYWNQKGNYKIDGDAKSYDLYPLTEPPIPPTGDVAQPPRKYENIAEFFKALMKQFFIFTLVLFGIMYVIACITALVIVVLIRRKRKVRIENFGLEINKGKKVTNGKTKLEKNIQRKKNNIITDESSN